MVLQLVIAFLLANLLNIEKLRLRKLYKTVLMFPWAMPGYVGILLWKTGMFNTQFGLLNQWMDKLGLTAVRWLSSDVSAFLSCTVVNLWLALPFMIMIMDGALQSIDKSYYESAILDGAGAFARAKYITIPAMRPIIAPAVIITVFTTFKQFDVVYLLTQQAGASVMLSICEDTSVITLDQVEARDKLRIVPDVGARLPIYCTSPGKVFLAAVSRVQDTARMISTALGYRKQEEPI